MAILAIGPLYFGTSRGEPWSLCSPLDLPIDGDIGVGIVFSSVLSDVKTTRFIVRLVDDIFIYLVLLFTAQKTCGSLNETGLFAAASLSQLLVPQLMPVHQVWAVASFGKLI